MVSHRKVSLKPHKIVTFGKSKMFGRGGKTDVLESLSNLAVTTTKPIKHLVGGASPFTPVKIPSVIRKSPIGKIF